MMKPRLLALLLVGSIAHAAPSEPASPAARLTGTAFTDGQAFALASSLSDHVGQRMTGTPSAERAVEWALKTMQSLGLKNVHKEPVKVPRWIRGDASAELVGPSTLPFHVVALGGSVGTPPAGITADVVEVSSVDELKALGDRAKGKIVLWNKPMQRHPAGEGYGAVVGLRGHGAVEAAKAGAVAALIRSVGTGSYRLPHTGATRYDDKVTKIPFAAISAEDADQLHRLLAGGEKVRVRLKLGAHQAGEADSFNVIGEVPGREKPDEIVLVGAHLDSWDLGTGALDDASGCAIALEAAALMVKLGMEPRRTVRVVLFMNEENGLSGARAYAKQHKDELARHVVAMEADSGAGRPIGLTVSGGAPAVELASRWAAPLRAFFDPQVKASDFGGADLIPMQQGAVPVLDVRQDMSTYFDWHHTAADTVDKIDPVELELAVSAFAALAHAAADAAETLPRTTPAQPNW
jgi:Zn-dependent M28 family amino/carboxypeptidase